MLRTVLKLFAGAVLLLLLAGGGVFLWASAESGDRLSRPYEVHDEPFPVPFPLEEEEAAGMTEEEARAAALAAAVERGRHLVASRYVCVDCHGEDLAGGVMIDAFPMGRVLGPNITGGEGSRTVGYTASDWDRIVRHGVRADGRPALMPSVDFRAMSDQELSDIVAYVGSLPPVDAVVPEPKLGPLGGLLLATGRIPLSAARLAGQDRHAGLPTGAEVSVEFGAHLAAVCAGCHGIELSGGPIPGGDPAWAVARNLTPHEEGLAAWTFEDFERALRAGVRPDGAALATPMDFVVPYTSQMTDVELSAMWAYLRTLEPRPTGS